MKYWNISAEMLPLFYYIHLQHKKQMVIAYLVKL